MKLDPDLVALVRKLVAEALNAEAVKVEIFDRSELQREDEDGPRTPTGERRRFVSLEWLRGVEEPPPVDARPPLNLRRN